MRSRKDLEGVVLNSRASESRMTKKRSGYQNAEGVLCGEGLLAEAVSSIEGHF